MLIALPMLPMSLKPRVAKPLLGTAGRPISMELPMIQNCAQAEAQAVITIQGLAPKFLPVGWLPQTW